MSKRYNRILKDDEESMQPVKIYKPDANGVLQLVETVKPVFDSGVTPFRNFPKKPSRTIVCEVCKSTVRSQIVGKTTCKKRSCELVIVNRKIETRKKMGLKNAGT